MSDETDDAKSDVLEPELSAFDTEAAGVSGLDEVRSDLLAAIEELGLGAGASEEAGAPANRCYLSIAPVDLHGDGGVVVGWLRRESAPSEASPLGELESVDILNEALGPLLLALGFPTEPYAVDGRWIVTGTRKTS
jgi:hypothetical protein